jgi:tRNA threonylcarbamoyladenosine biosynthesis protein TsaB
MPTLLHIETATQVCSVALSRSGQLLSIRESSVKNAHSSVLTTFIEEVFSSSDIKVTEIDAVAVSEGPGSYTGLRIGVATAKGLCYALDKPLMAIPTLKSMAAGMAETEIVKHHASSVTVLCPMIDARRMEVFSAVFGCGLEEIIETRAEIITRTSFEDLLKKYIIVFAGDGAEKCKSFLDKHDNILFLDDFRVSARHMMRLAEKKFLSREFENLAYFEPRYLKEFIAGKPRVKGLI